MCEPIRKQILWLVGVGLVCAVMQTLAEDQVELQNGDRFAGQVLSLNADTLVLRSEVLGTVKLPRSRLATVTFNAARAPVAAPLSATAVRGSTNRVTSAPPALGTNDFAAVSAALQRLEGSSNVTEQLSEQLLSGANPETRAKFNEMLSDYFSGKLSVQDIRKQAQSAAAQLRALKKELGDSDAGALDAYLGILDKFLNETPAASVPSR